MKIKYLNQTVLDNLINYGSNILTMMETASLRERAVLIFNANFYFAVKLRLIYPVKNLGDRGPLKINFLNSDYFYTIESVTACRITQDITLAQKLLLPQNCFTNFVGTPRGSSFIYHCPPYVGLVKPIDSDNVSMEFLIGCLQFLKNVVEFRNKKYGKKGV